MQLETFDGIRPAISEDRLEPYFRYVFPSGTPTESEHSSKIIICYALYMWNTVLGESLYPSFQAIEVALRNSVHTSVWKAFNNEFWFESILASNEQQRLSEVKDRLLNDRKPFESSRVVAGLTFGFWVSLFDKRYEGVLWPQLLEEVFPNIPRTLRTRRNILKRLMRVLRLRNRVFHHEPIWHWKDLADQHRETLEAIEWLNPPMLSMVSLFDRFPAVHRDGRHNCEETLKGYIGQQPQVDSGTNLLSVLNRVLDRVRTGLNLQ